MPKYIKGEVGYSPEEALEWLKKRTREDEPEMRKILKEKQKNSQKTYA